MSYVPEGENGKRRYGVWAGNPQGTLENKERCIVEVANPPSWTTVQCSRKRGYGRNGEFCKQHAKKQELK
jgi:hypothetical protein